MARRIQLEPHLTVEELEGRYRSTKDLVERSHWHFLWLLARGLTAKSVASITGYSAYWIGRIARRYNEHGLNGVKDLRHQSRPSVPLLSASQQDALVAALTVGPATEGERWSGRTVAAWICQRLGRRIGRQLGWAYLRRLGARLRVPEHIHLLFLPAHSPELQPAEPLWPLTNTVLVNRHFAKIEDSEDAQAERCITLQGQQNLVRSATRFHWWPRHIHRRHGPHAR